jgi:predicted nucleic acid-binding protein
MSLVYWDTMLFVYWLEDNAAYTERIERIFSGMEARGDQLVTSAFAVGEVLVGPHKAGDADAVARIREGIQEVAGILPFTGETAAQYAIIRARHGVSPADAIHLASAADARVDLFLTNDAELIGKVIPGIQFIAGLDVNLY